MSFITSSGGVINELETNNIHIVQDNSKLTWDSVKKHSDITKTVHYV